MKKLLIFALLLAAMPGHASTTNVTATVTDTDGQAWTNGTWSASILMAGGTFANTRPTIAGVAVPSTASGTLSSSGVLTATLTDTSSLDQAGAQWVIVVCPNASVPPYGLTGCARLQTPISGSSLNLTPKLSSVAAPRFPAGTGSSAYGYLDAEVLTPSVAGLSYFNTSTNTALTGLRVWDGRRWVGGGNGGSGSIANNPKFYAPYYSTNPNGNGLDGVGITGLGYFSTSAVPRAAGQSDIVNLWPTCSGYLKNDGSCSTVSTAVSGSVAGTGNNLSGQNFVGYLLARQYQSSSTSNNGVANAISAQGSTPWAMDMTPDYAYTDRIGHVAQTALLFAYTMPYSSTSGSSIYDYRAGQHTEAFRNPPSNITDASGWVAQDVICIVDDLPGWSAGTAPQPGCRNTTFQDMNPGYNYGNPGVSTNVNWSEVISQKFTNVFWGAGIGSWITATNYYLGEGDKDNIDFTNIHKPAHIRGGDEGPRDFEITDKEADPYAGVVSGQSTMGGQTTLTISSIGGGGIGGLGDLHPVIDLGNAAISIASVANASGGQTVYTYTSTQTPSGSNAWVGGEVVTSGLTNSANNGIFHIVASTTTTVTLDNASGVAETTTANMALNVIQCSGSSNTGATIVTVTVTGCTLPVSKATGTLGSAISIPSHINGVPIAYTMTFTGLSGPLVAGRDVVEIYDSTFFDSSVVSNLGTYSGGTQTATVYLTYSAPSGTAWCVGGTAGRYIEIPAKTSGDYRYVIHSLCSPTSTTMYASEITAAGLNAGGVVNQINGAINIYFGGMLLDARNMANPNNAVDGLGIIASTSSAGAYLPGTTVQNTNNIIGAGGGIFQRYHYIFHNPFAAYGHLSVEFDGIGTVTGAVTEYFQNDGAPSQYTAAGGSFLAPIMREWNGPLGIANLYQYEPVPSQYLGNTRTGTVIDIEGLMPGSTATNYELWHDGVTNSNMVFYNSNSVDPKFSSGSMDFQLNRAFFDGALYAGNGSTYGILGGISNPCQAGGYLWVGQHAINILEGTGTLYAGPDNCGLANFEMLGNGATESNIRVASTNVTGFFGAYPYTSTNVGSQAGTLYGATYIRSWMTHVNAPQGNVNMYPWLCLEQLNGISGTKVESACLDEHFVLRIPYGAKTDKIDPTSITPTGTPSTSGGTIAAGLYQAAVTAIDQYGMETSYSKPSAVVTTTGSTSSITWTFPVATGINDAVTSYRLYNPQNNGTYVGNAYFAVPLSDCSAGTCTYVQTTFTQGTTFPPLTDNTGGFNLTNGYLGGNWLMLHSQTGAPSGVPAGTEWYQSSRKYVYDGTTNQVTAWLGDLGIGVAVATSSLPACGSTNLLTRRSVTDATSNTAGSAPTGGGTWTVPVVCEANSGTYAWYID